jgi:hypothetical protein
MSPAGTFSADLSRLGAFVANPTRVFAATQQVAGIGL